MKWCNNWSAHLAKLEHLYYKVVWNGFALPYSDMLSPRPTFEYHMSWFGMDFRSSPLVICWYTEKKFSGFSSLPPIRSAGNAKKVTLIPDGSRCVIMKGLSFACRRVLFVPPFVSRKRMLPASAPILAGLSCAHENSFPDYPLPKSFRFLKVAV